MRVAISIETNLRNGKQKCSSYQVRDRFPIPDIQRLKRVFQIDVETCPSCGGTVKIIASIEDPPVIERILNHLASKELPGLWAESRAPPVCVYRTGRPAGRTGSSH